MAKVKIKKQLRLPELIQWGFENDIKNEFYRTQINEKELKRDDCHR